MPCGTSNPIFHYTVVICDDEPAVQERIRQLLRSTIQVNTQIYEFTGQKELEKALKNGLQPDIALMDIELGTENGIQIAQKLFPTGTKTQVIFITGYMQYCTSVYNTEHIYFLLKPIQEEEFQRAIQKALDRLQRLPELCLTLCSKDKVWRIPFASIHYLESMARKVTIHCHDQILSSYTTLDTLSTNLPDNFVRCHQSFCVNMDFITRMEPHQFTLESGDTIPISQGRRLYTKDTFFQYLRRSL